MKKKASLFGVVLVLLLCICAAIPAFASSPEVVPPPAPSASPSPTPGSPVVTPPPSVTPGVVVPGEVDVGNSVLPVGAAKIKKEPATAAEYNTVESYAKNNKLAGRIVGVFDLSILDENNNSIQPDGNTVIRWNMPGLKSYDTVTLVHIMADGKIELWPATCYDGYFTFKPTSLSPIGIVYNQGTPPQNTTSVTAPQTGVADWN